MHFILQWRATISRNVRSELFSFVLPIGKLDIKFDNQNSISDNSSSSLPVEEGAETQAINYSSAAVSFGEIN